MDIILTDLCLTAARAKTPGGRVASLSILDKYASYHSLSVTANLDPVA